MNDARWAGVGATLAVMIASIAPGCDDGTSTDGSTASTASGATDGVTLTVLSYERVKSITTGAGTGKIFLTVDLRIKNGTANSLLLPPSAFSLRTDSSLQYGAAPETVELSDFCGAAPLGPGGDAHCQLAFKIALDTVTTKIVYTDPTTETQYASPFTIDPCNVCNDGCIAPGAMCCDPATDLQNDVQNCGQCGHVCPIPPDAVMNASAMIRCEFGKCSVAASTHKQMSCDAFCSSAGLSCVEGQSNYCCEDVNSCPDVLCVDDGPPAGDACELLNSPFKNMYCACKE